MHFGKNDGVVLDFIHYIGLYGCKENLFFSPQNFTVLSLFFLSQCQSYSLWILSSLFFSFNTLKHSCFIICLITTILGVFVGLFMLSVVSCPQ